MENIVTRKARPMPMELLNTKGQPRVEDLLKEGTPGKHKDGKGLYLQVAGPGRASWTVQYRLNGQTKWMSIGSAFDYKLPQARAVHKEIRRKAQAGIDPRKANLMVMASPSLVPATPAGASALIGAVDVPAPTGPEFGAVVAEYLGGYTDKDGKFVPGKAANWKGDKEAASYRALMGIDFANLPVDAITTADVLSALLPWHDTPPTWEKNRARIAKVLGYCAAKDYRSRDLINPAMLKGHIEHMPRPIADGEEHHPALPYDELPQFMKELRAIKTNESRALQWTILNAVRTADTIDATGSEIQGKMWIVPRERTKGRKGKTRELRVPLTAQTVALLPKQGQPSDYLFPGRVKARMWHSSMLELLKELRPGRDLTVHGFRSTFRDWVSDKTSHDPNLAEIALHHVVGKKTERAYARSVMVEKRRKLMADWAKFTGAR
jgi:integrase